MNTRKTPRRNNIKLEAMPSAIVLDETMDEAAASAFELPTGSGDTIVNTDVDMSDDGPATQSAAADEGYHTSFVGKEPTPAPKSSTTVRSSQPPSQSSAATRLLPETTAESRSESRTVESSGGLDLLGRGVKKLVQGMNFLRQLGVENLVDPLPKIVVVGGQSTGKSSLIEAISEIKVPRNTGTTTRCPIEINLSEASNVDPKWSCKVILHRKYSYQPHDSFLIPSKESYNHPLGPWVKWEPEEFLFATLDNKDDLEKTLFRAQLANLNPNVNPELYTKESTAPNSVPVKFSPNVVRLDITGPNLPNLSFFDLPGVINVADNRERYLVGLVANLVKEYIKADNCINLLTLPMNDDVENSTAYGLIKDEEAEHRTIGVLTKPDCIHKGDRFEHWKTILDGREHQLGHGYFVTKQCNQADIDLGVDHAKARAQENDFFADTEPWASELAHYNQRFGTVNLQTFLSQKLTEQIRTSLPHIDEQVRKKAAAIDLELATLPEPPAGNLQVEIHNLLTAFNSRLQQYLDRGSSLSHFHISWMYLVEQFRDSIMKSHPKLVVGDLSGTPRKITMSVEPERRQSRTPGTPTPFRGHPINLIDSEDDNPPKPESASQSSGKRVKRATGASQETPKKRKTILERIPEVQPFHTVKGLPKVSLTDVRKAIRDAKTSLNPLHVDPKAADGLSMASVKHWDKGLVELLQRTDQSLRDLVARCLNDIFGIYKRTELFSELSTLCNGFLKRIMEEQSSVCQRVYDLEVLEVYALNEPALEGYRAAALADLSEARRIARANAFLNDQETKLGKFTAGPERELKLLKVTDNQIGVDPFAKEVDVMSMVRGYYTYAASRFVENVCQAIQLELFIKCRNHLYGELRGGLKIVGPGADDRCAQLLAEDPQLEIKRAQLKKERETLTKAQNWFARLAEDDSDIQFDQDLFVS